MHSYVVDLLLYLLGRVAWNHLASPPLHTPHCMQFVEEVIQVLKVSSQYGKTYTKGSRQYWLNMVTRVSRTILACTCTQLYPRKSA